MILGFEEMVSRCVDDEAKVHIREAVRCYEAGAYRAAIVSAHVSVCFDLIAKLRSLASGGDQAAGGLVAKLDSLQKQQSVGNPSAIKGLLEMERHLLEEFRDNFDFFGSQEFEELSRLRADRNRCAHPTFSHNTLPYAPAAELARLHIRSALIYVLSQPPKQGKAALASLRAVIVSPYFPTIIEDAVERLRGSEIGTAREVLIRAFIDDLAFGWPDPASPYNNNSNVPLALEAIIELHRSIAVPRLVIALQKLAKSGVADAVRFAGAIAVRIPEVSEQVDDATKVVLKTWLLQEASENKGRAIKGALQVGWWRDNALQALATINAEQLRAVNAPPPEMVAHAAQLYGTARNWYDANKLAEEVINPWADRFLPADVEHVFERSQNGADLTGSHGFREFIRLLYDKNSILNDDLEVLLDAHGLGLYKEADQIAGV